MNMKDGQGHPILSCGGISVLEKKKKQMEQEGQGIERGTREQRGRWTVT